MALEFGELDGLRNALRDAMWRKILMTTPRSKMRRAGRPRLRWSKRFEPEHD